MPVVDDAASPVGTLGSAEQLPPPPPPLLAPLQDNNTKASGKIQTASQVVIVFDDLFDDRFEAPSTRPLNISPGNSIHIDNLEWVESPVDDEVEIVMTTSTAEFPGVIAPEGLNEHCAPAGSPEQESVTVPLNDVPTGWTTKL